ncbi:MAG: DUF2304 domain-containing protein [Cellulomonas sp.]
MTGYPFALALCAIAFVAIAYLLRARRIREKYAAIWLVVLAAILVLGAFPAVLTRLAGLVGVETPSNLLFATSIVVLLLVCIQLSTEVSQLEEETRTLAEEVALLGRRLDVVEGRQLPADAAEDDRT